MRAYYLLGFASSAQSTKAAFFAGRLAALGVPMRTPDFNEPDFETITITRMVAQVISGLEGEDEPAVLFGSSLGGYVAIQAAVQRPHSVQALVLLAPALEFWPKRASSAPAGSAAADGVAPAGGGTRLQDLGDRGIEEWRRTDRLDVFHYAFGRVMPVRYALYEDAQRHDASRARPGMPVQVFQGRRDTAVDPDVVRRWSDARPNVELHMLDDDHQLLGSLEYIWAQARRFLQL
jgi:pimeloyl-ACP methyl ester carboxylesterase